MPSPVPVAATTAKVRNRSPLALRTAFHVAWMAAAARTKSARWNCRGINISALASSQSTGPIIEWAKARVSKRCVSSNISPTLTA